MYALLKVILEFDTYHRIYIYIYVYMYVCVCVRLKCHLYMHHAPMYIYIYIYIYIYVMTLNLWYVFTNNFLWDGIINKFRTHDFNNDAQDKRHIRHVDASITP